MKRDELRKIAREAQEKLIRDVEAGLSETLKSYLKAMGSADGPVSVTMAARVFRS
jgi:hypothetical protein